ncbi:deoxycytidylate deaminase [Aminobacter niigataensis]|uniref:Deoxycytidylate deaminase n=1 Tax=Aminobacter niigataensis TaxID=83265 RepID=A0ABR6L1N3_9HYPH|nr:deaminase [Aminobacter niigataensis]MBB4650548.1 deoxycytidylate deaminase [Aminobacter niigataensis]
MMHRAVTAGARSPIASRQVGAVIADSRGLVISEACNEPVVSVRLPEKFDLNSDDSKNFWVEHAERSAIYAAIKKGNGLQGCTIYTTLFPCASCMRAIIQCEMAVLVAPLPDYSLEKWSQEFRHSKMIQENSTLVFRPFIAEEVLPVSALG